MTDLDHLKTLRALPPSQIVTFGGRRVTAGEAVSQAEAEALLPENAPLPVKRNPWALLDR